MNEDAHKDWLRRQLTVEQAEAENTVGDDRLGQMPLAFGSSNSEWKELLAQMQSGDELWEYCSPVETWDFLYGRAGFAIVRDGEIVASMLTSMN